MKVIVTLNKKARTSAMKAMKARGNPLPLDFLGPTFEDVQSYDMGLTGLYIYLKDNVEYWYPNHTLARVKVEH